MGRILLLLFVLIGLPGCGAGVDAPPDESEAPAVALDWFMERIAGADGRPGRVVVSTVADPLLVQLSGAQEAPRSVELSPTLVGSIQARHGLQLILCPSANRDECHNRDDEPSTWILYSPPVRQGGLLVYLMTAVEVDDPGATAWLHTDYRVTLAVRDGRWQVENVLATGVG